MLVLTYMDINCAFNLLYKIVWLMTTYICRYANTVCFTLTLTEVEAYRTLRICFIEDVLFAFSCVFGFRRHSNDTLQPEL